MEAADSVFCFVLFLASPCSLWDLSSQIRDRTTVVIIFSWNTLSGTRGQQRPLADSPLLSYWPKPATKASILYIQTSQCLVNRQQKDTVTSKNYKNSKWLFQATKF